MPGDLTIPGLLNRDTPKEIISRAFTPHSDLTYKTLDGLSLTDVSVHQSLLTGSVLRGCKFDSVDFSRCDLDGVRIESCSFTKCSFENNDFRTVVFGGSHLDACNFNKALIEDCHFQSCSIKSCRLEEAVIRACTFNEGAIESSSIRKSSFVDGTFRHVAIADMDLGDCTFLFNIMTGCTFHNVGINAESLGMIYGLTEENLQSLSFIFLGQQLGKPADARFVDEVLDSYEKRKWHSGAAIIRLNLGRVSRLNGLLSYLKALRAWSLERSMVKRDETLFLVRIIEDLAKQNRLPFFVCIEALEFARATFAAVSDSGASGQGTAAVREFSSAITLVMQDQLDRHQAQALLMGEHDEDYDLILKAQFRVRPPLPLADTLNDIASACELPIRKKTESLRSREGSYEEFLSTTFLTLGALQIALFMINGIVSQITLLRARAQVLKRKRLPRPYIEQALQPVSVSKSLLSAIDSIFKKLSNLPWLEDPRLGGLDDDNIVSLDAEEPEDPTGPTSEDS